MQVIHQIKSIPKLDYKLLSNWNLKDLFVEEKYLLLLLTNYNLIRYKIAQIRFKSDFLDDFLFLILLIEENFINIRKFHILSFQFNVSDKEWAFIVKFLKLNKDFKNSISN